MDRVTRYKIAFAVGFACYALLRIFIWRFNKSQEKLEKKKYIK